MSTPEPEFQAYWAARVIEVPAGASTVSVDDLEAPQAVIFFGTNWLPEDTVVIPASSPQTALGMFRGIVGRKPDDSLFQGATAIVEAGDAAYPQTGYAIAMCDATGSGVFYRATVTLTETGFDAAFDVGHAGGYKVVCLVLSGADHCVAVHSDGGTETHTIGFRARSQISHGWWSSGLAFNDPGHGSWYGGSNWMSDSEFGFQGCGICCHMWPQSVGHQGQSEMYAITASTGFMTTTASFPFFALTPANVQARPVTDDADEDEVRTEFGPGPGSMIAWDGWSELGSGSHVQAAGGEWTKTGLPFEPAALIGYTISDEGLGLFSSIGDRGAVGFSVVCGDTSDPDGEPFQWCALVDGDHAGAFQSFQRGFVDSVYDSTVHAGTIELTEDGFTMTTVEDSATKQGWVWHAFGIPEIEHPIIYRHGVRYRV